MKNTCTAQRNIKIVLIASFLLQLRERTAFVVFCGVVGFMILNFKENTDDNDLRHVESERGRFAFGFQSY